MAMPMDGRHGQISQKTRLCIDIQAITPKLNKDLNNFRNLFICHNLEIERHRLKHFVVYFSIISVLCFLKIFRYLDTIDIVIILKRNKILDFVFVGLHMNKYIIVILFCEHVYFFVSALAKLSTQVHWCYNNLIHCHCMVKMQAYRSKPIVIPNKHVSTNTKQIYFRHASHKLFAAKLNFIHCH
jgi:hypothetical protein